MYDIIGDKAIKRSNSTDQSPTREGNVPCPIFINYSDYFYYYYIEIKRRLSSELSVAAIRRRSLSSGRVSPLNVSIPPELDNPATTRQPSSTHISHSSSWFPFFTTRNKLKSEFVTMKKMNKSTSEFDSLRLIQTCTSHIGPIWCMKVSRDGKFLATAGKDCRIIVWCLGKPPKLKAHTHFTSMMAFDAMVEDTSETSSFPEDISKLELIASTPYHIWCGHTLDITDICWSISHFLLSASADKTVRLWNIFRYLLAFTPRQFLIGCIERIV